MLKEIENKNTQTHTHTHEPTLNRRHITETALIV